MKVLITNIYSFKNKGDATIVFSAIEGLKKKHKNPEFILSTDDLNDKGKYGDYQVVSSFTRLFHNKFKRDFLNSIINFLYYLRLISIFKVERFLYRYKIRFDLIYGGNLKKKLQSYREADIVYAIGGGYLLTKTSLRKIDKLFGRISLHIVCLEFYFAKAYRKSIVLLHQSIGPFNYSQDVKQTIGYLSNIDLIVSREKYTFNLLRSNGINNTILKSDLAFTFDLPGNSFFNNPLIPRFNNKLGITARVCLPAKEQSRYENALIEFITYYLNEYTDAAIYFIPQVIYAERYDDDTSVAKKIYSSIAEELQGRLICIEDDLPPQDLKATISECEFFVGTRMHSNIFALSSYVKTIALAYEYKTTGIMEMLGLAEYTVSVEKVTSDFLITAIQNLKKDEYFKSNLSTRIERMILGIWDFDL